MWNPALLDGPITIDGAPGYHLNVAPQVFTDALTAFRVFPDSPERQFAGAETVFLAFADEAQAIEHLAGWWIEPTGDEH
jgi:hypothetical protein